MNDDVQDYIKARKQKIETLTRELIKRLNLPYIPDDIHEDAPLLGAGLGLDSLDALEVVLCIETCFGVKVPDNSISILRSINTIVDYLFSLETGKEAMK